MCARKPSAVFGWPSSGSVNNPQGFGSYVYSVCKNVLSESRRDDSRNQHDSLEFNDVPDEKLSLEELIELRGKSRVGTRDLDELPERDRHLLQARSLKTAITKKFPATLA